MSDGFFSGLNGLSCLIGGDGLSGLNDLNSLNILNGQKILVV